MPSLAGRACSTPGCRNLCTSSRCDGCAKQAAGERPTAAQRGYGWRWQKASKAFLRANPFAVDYFGVHNGRVFPAECVDHIIPHRGDMELFWRVSNWQGLTFADHARKTALEDGGFGNAAKVLAGRRDQPVVALTPPQNEKFGLRGFDFTRRED